MSSSERMEGAFVCDGADGWRLMHAEWTETLNEPYRATLRIAHPDGSAGAQRFVGKSAAIVLRRRGVEERLAGIVTEVRDGLRQDEASAAELIIEPALCATLHKKDTRIFQHLTVPDILQRVLSADLAPFERSVELTLSRAYPPREYTVQYDETDFDFVHRLMEEEGITYFFEHEGEKERMRLTDRGPQHPEIRSERGTSLVFTERVDAGVDHIEGVFAFESVGRMTGTRVAVRAFDWTHPSLLLESEVDATDGGPSLESYEVRHHVTMTGFSMSGYAASDVGQQATLLGELQRRDRSAAEGRSSSAALRTGARFSLEGHPAPELDREYLVVRVEHRFRATSGTGAQGASMEGLTYENRFRLIPSDVPWRPDRVRDRPRIHGIQTATVVGPSGEEIHTDPHGRVMVQFHWDRLGERNEHSSCWIRVIQPMGGPGWGFTFVPRIGQEVVVTFVDGDPDQPVVYGAIFNGENPIPLDYPANKTRMTIKSNSSPGGGGFNELRFEDLAGLEEIWLHGQRDWNTLIKNDLTRRVERDESQDVVRFRTRTVGVDERVTVGQDMAREVKRDKSEKVDRNRMRQVGANEMLTVGANRALTVGGSQAVSIGGMSQTNVGANSTVNVIGDHTLSVGLKSVEKAGVLIRREAPTIELVAGPSKLTLKDTGEIELTNGPGKITFDPGGIIEIKGPMVKINC
ncbi:MAG: type VI secretion system Vgr family protein [Sandaracinaceae bacterium]